MTEREVLYCTTEDGVRIAYSTQGEGPALLICPFAFESFSLDHLLPEQVQFIDTLKTGRRLVRYDWRGTGLSMRDVQKFEPGSQLLDLEAVSAAIGNSSFVLWASGVAGPTAITFAARHPDRLDGLVLFSTFANFGDVFSEEAMGGFREIARTNWPLAARMFGDMSTREADPQAGLRWGQVYLESTTGELFARFAGRGDPVDATPDLPAVRAQTLVMHRRGDLNFPFKLGQQIAASIPNAKFVPLEGVISHYSLGDQDAVLRAALPFLPNAEDVTQMRRAPRELPQGTAVILFADIADSTALTERLGDAAFRAKARDLDAALRTVIREHAGTAIEGKLLGDGVLAVFTSARQAIEAALACATEREGAGLPLHLGLHAGDVIREDNNVYGGAVNIASRISGLSAPGEVLVSETVRSLARTSAGVRFEDRGEQSLKGVGEPVRVWAVREAV